MSKYFTAFNRNNSILSAEYIVTHAGQSHRDEFIAIALTQAVRVRYGKAPMAVYRRDPTEEELNNSKVLVLDVGGQLDPAKLNFDHHQMHRDAPPACAMTLLCRHGLYIDEELSIAFPWYAATELIDSKGPFAMAKELGLPNGLPPELNDPIARVVLQWFGDVEEVNPHSNMASLMIGIGEGIISRAEELLEGLRSLEEKAEVVTISGVRVLLAPEAIHPPVKMFAAAKGVEIGVVVSKDDRGLGLSLFRVDDHPQVDFSRIDNEEEIVFAHKGGFIAKTSSTSCDIQALLKKSISPE